MKHVKAILVLALLSAITTTAAADDWPFLYGPNSDNISTETGWLDDTPSADDVKVLWTKKLGVSCSGVVVSGGKAYTMSNTGIKGEPDTHFDIVYCFDAETGKEIWTRKYKCGLNFKSNTPGGPFATPTVNDGRVYTFSRKGDVHCLDADTGHIIWYKDVKTELGMEMPFQGGFASSPLIVDDMVILNAGVAGTALNKLTGEVVWKSNRQVAAQATCVPFIKNGKKCVAVFSGVGLVAVDAATGKELFRHLWPTKYKTNAPNPVILPDKIFISTEYSMGAVLLDIAGKKPKVIWQIKDMQNHYSTSIYWKDHLFGFDKTKLKCIDAKDGSTKWILAGAYGKGNFMMADGKLIVLTEKGQLLVGEASPEGFTPVIDTNIIGGKSYAQPVLANNRIYARNLTGDMVCITLNSGKTK